MSDRTVLVIEDDENHAEAIAVALKADGWEVQCEKSIAIREFLKFKAKHPYARIIVLDLELRDGSGEPEDGIKLMRELWAIDRTSSFVIFSRHVGRRPILDRHILQPMVVEVSKEAPEPEVVALPSGKEDETSVTFPPVPSQAGLAQLCKAVRRAETVSLPGIAVPEIPWISWIQEVERFGQSNGIDSRSTQSVSSGMRNSARVSEALREAGVEVSTGGMPARAVCAGVYGSCGRGELRENSDVEFSTLYWEYEDLARGPGEEILAYVNARSDGRGTTDDPEKEEAITRGEGAWRPLKVAVLAWNRIALGLDRLGRWPYEGKESLPDGWLDEERVDEDLANAFRPVMSARRILDAELHRDPHVRNRYFQILSELQPVYNSDMIWKLKIALVQMLFPDRTISFGRDLLRQGAFEFLCQQYEMDTFQRMAPQMGKVKSLAYRLLPSIALRLTLIRLSSLNEWRLEEDCGMTSLVEALQEPPLVKAVRFAHASNGHEYEAEAVRFAVSHLRLLDRMATRFSSVDAGVSEFAEDLGDALQKARTLFRAIALQWEREHQSYPRWVCDEGVATRGIDLLGP